MLPTVDAKVDAGDRRGLEKIANRLDDILGRGRAAKRGLGMGLRKTRFALIPRRQRDPGRNSDNTQPRCKVPGHEIGGMQKRSFTQGVGKKITVWIEQFLVEDVHHHALRVAITVRMQCLSQHERSGEVGEPVRAQRSEVAGRWRVMVKERGVVDQRVHPAEVPQHLIEERAGRGFLGEICAEKCNTASAIPEAFSSLVCRLRRVQIMQGEIPALFAESQRDGASQALGRAGDERDFSQGGGVGGGAFGSHRRFQRRFQGEAPALQAPGSAFLSASPQRAAQCNLLSFAFRCCLRPVSSSPVSPTRLADILAERLRASGNWLRFDAFMDLALYTPHLGYYCRERTPFGRDGDFVTAPALSPLFAACLSRQIAEVLDRLGTQQLLEFGAGDGLLATQILASMRSKGYTPHYAIVEVSAPLRALQRARILAAHAPDLNRLAWLERLPEPGFRGVVLANEVLDAMPVRLFVFAGEHRGQGVWFERGVSSAPQSMQGQAATLDARAPALVFSDRELDATQSQVLDAHRAHCQALWDEPWPEGMVVEWHEQAQAWLRTLAGRIAAGMILLIDYGFPAHEYYLPARHEGTLLAHRSHRVTAAILERPGDQDLSVHLDFTALARVGLESGLDLAGYCTQARFLLNCGVLDLAASLREPLLDRDQCAREASASVEHAQGLAGLQRLISDAEMGELFKVMALTRGIDSELLGFRRGDRRGRLGLEAVRC